MTTVSSAELVGDRSRLAVGQREEDDVVTGQRLGGGLVQHPVGERHQVGLERTEELARVGARR